MHIGIVQCHNVVPVLSLALRVKIFQTRRSWDTNDKKSNSIFHKPVISLTWANQFRVYSKILKD
jgi:hypothetical protein